MPRGSFKTSDFSVGGGLYEGPAEISNARVGKTDYNGKSTGGSATALLLNITYMNADDEEEVKEQIFSMGKGLEPSEDGEEPAEEGPFYWYPEGGKDLNSTTSAAIFLASVSKARGADLDPDKGMEDLNGLKVVLKRRTLPAIEEGGKPRKVYEVTEVLDELPWEEKPKGKKVTSPKGK
jgi:hypothetical protein